MRLNVSIKASLKLDRRIAEKIAAAASARACAAIALNLVAAIKLMLSRPGQGEMYPYGYSKEKKWRQASAPRDPPAVDTGRLRNSIISVPGSDASMLVGPSIEAKATQGDSRGATAMVDYAMWLEFGTEKMEARPFMRPVFDRYRAARADYQTVIRNAARV